MTIGDAVISFTDPLVKVIVSGGGVYLFMKEFNHIAAQSRTRGHNLVCLRKRSLQGHWRSLLPKGKLRSR